MTSIEKKMIVATAVLFIIVCFSAVHLIKTAGKVATAVHESGGVKNVVEQIWHGDSTKQ